MCANVDVYTYRFLCDAGFTGCCTDKNCTVIIPGSPVCYCDSLCHVFKDCCNDIDLIDCHHDSRKLQIIK